MLADISIHSCFVKRMCAEPALTLCSRGRKVNEMGSVLQVASGLKGRCRLDALCTISQVPEQLRHPLPRSDGTAPRCRGEGAELGYEEVRGVWDKGKGLGRP